MLIGQVWVWDGRCPQRTAEPCQGRVTVWAVKMALDSIANSAGAIHCGTQRVGPPLLRTVRPRQRLLRESALRQMVRDRRPGYP